ncbi:MAG: CHAT domain-containing protein [Pleurocapsa sp.]
MFRRLLVIFILAFGLTMVIPLSGNTQSEPSFLVKQGREYYQTGEFDRAIQLLERANLAYSDRRENLSQADVFIQSLAEKLEVRSPQVQYKTLLSLGNLHKAIALQEKERNNLTSFAYNTQEAIKYYQKITNSSLSKRFLPLERLQAQLNQLFLFIETQQWSKARQQVSQIDVNHLTLTANQGSIYAKVNLARSLTLLKQNSVAIDYSWNDIVAIYDRAINNARQFGDRRIESYALGYLGQLQQEQQIASEVRPQQLIEQALNLAQTIQAPEIAYRWQWELGKIYRQQGDRAKAISAYQAAVKTLKNLRSDLVSLNREIQFSFRQQVEPVYLELIDLLLTNDSTNLETVRDVIESLEIAELDNYFQDACSTFEQHNIDEIDPSAAIIYTIVLPDRLEVILSLSDRTFRRHTEVISQTDLETTIEQLRYDILQPDKVLETQQLATQIYHWLITPFLADLQQNNPTTLVFLLNDSLQTIPMAALYDGKQYLIEQYALALTPSLRLLNPQQQSDTDKVLAGGVSKPLQIANQQFTALTNVTEELDSIKSIFNAKILLNSQFTLDNLAQQLQSQPTSILHLASHGQFSSNPDGTFLLLWQKLLTIQDFNYLLKNRKQVITNPIDLLVLSACETAIGDKRATLGLAGMAVRSGVVSTLATLWQVNDDSTASLMQYFYQQLRESKELNKAQALQKAQLAMWNNLEKDWQVPMFWAAYVLVGNWQ